MARTPAERTRLHRARARGGAVLVRGAVPKWLTEQMVDSGRYPDSDHPEIIWDAVVTYIAAKTGNAENK